MHFLGQRGAFPEFRPGGRRLRPGHNAALADAAATALGNRVPGPGPLPRPWTWAAALPEILGAVVIVGDKLGAWGRVELVPLAG